MFGQGNVLSPFIFNVFLNDLLKQLEDSPCGLNIGKSKSNSLAYADDIDTFATNTRDLQTLVSLCFDYSIKWRFKFGITKSQFFIAGSKNVELNPVIKLGNSELTVSDSMEILGKTYSSNGKASEHIYNRMQKCRNALHSVGFRNPELCPRVKAHLWKSIGLPSLLYSVSTGSVTPGQLQLLESFQGHMIKSTLYLDKRARHSNILHSLGIDSITDLINSQRVNLLRRVFQAPVSSYSVLCSELISRYYSTGVAPKDTLIGSVIALGLSPITVALSKTKIYPTKTNIVQSDGLTDSINYILQQHIRPGNDQHMMLRYLTRSFHF